jgi:hypothetical protein
MASAGNGSSRALVSALDGLSPRSRILAGLESALARVSARSSLALAKGGMYPGCRVKSEAPEQLSESGQTAPGTPMRTPGAW